MGPAASLRVRPEQSPSENAGCEPHTSNEDSPIDALLSGESGSVLRQCHQDCPDEATEFSGDSGDGDVTMLALIEPEELVDQTELCFLGDSDNIGWLSLTSAFEDKGGAGIVPVVPGSFDEEAPHVDITGLGDGTAVLPVAGGVLGRHKTKIRHEGTWGSEASNVADLDQERESCKGLDASQAAEGFDGVPVAWEGSIAFELGVQGSLHSLQVLEMLQFGSQGRLERSLEAVVQLR